MSSNWITECYPIVFCCKFLNFWQFIMRKYLGLHTGVILMPKSNENCVYQRANSTGLHCMREFYDCINILSSKMRNGHSSFSKFSIFLHPIRYAHLNIDLIYTSLFVLCEVVPFWTVLTTTFGWSQYRTRDCSGYWNILGLGISQHVVRNLYFPIKRSAEVFVLRVV